MRPGETTELEAAWALSSVVRELCERAGVPYDAVDATLLEGYVDGFYATGGASSATASIQALAGVYQFDASNYDGALHFIPRGGESVADITDDDLVDDGQMIEMQTRADPINIPRVMQLRYFDTRGGLTPNQQVSDRSNDYRATSEISKESTVILNTDSAIAAITIQHKVEIEEQRGEREFSLPVNWLNLTVSDVIKFRGERMRITSVDIDDCIQKYRASFDRLSAYDSSASAVPILEPSTPPDNVPADTVLHLIDSRILQDAHDSVGLYIACAGTSDNWQGAVVQYSRDGGVNWLSGGVIRTSTTMGELISELPVGPIPYPDYRNYVDVELLRDDMTLTPATLTEMMNRANLCLIGDEIINFSEVEQLTATTWRLSGFLRGRKGTDSVTHAIGERFVLLNPAMVTFTQVESYNINMSLTFRATSIGAETTEETQTLLYIANSQKEQEPSYFRARRYKNESAAQKVQLTWIGTGRLGGGAMSRLGRMTTGYRVYSNAFSYFVTLNTTPRLDDDYTEGTVYYCAQDNQMTGLGEIAEATTV